jgi:hypothetical protein
MDIEYLKQYQYNTDLQFSNKYLVKDAENTTPQVIQWKISQSQIQTKKRGRPPKPKVEVVPKPKVEMVPKPKVRRVTKIKVVRLRKPIEPEPQIIIDRNINRTIIF